MSQPWIVMMPEGWTPTNCPSCPLKECMVDETTIPNFCPLANAKKAVEVKAGQVQLFPCPGATPVYIDKDGVIVTLYAVESEK